MMIFIDVTELKDKNLSNSTYAAIARITMLIVDNNNNIVQRKFIEIEKTAWDTCERKAGKEAIKEWLSTPHPMPESEKDQYVFVTSYENAVYEVAKLLEKHTIKRSFCTVSIPTIYYVNNCENLYNLGRRFYKGNDSCGNILGWNYNQVECIENFKNKVLKGQKVLDTLNI